MPLVGQFEEGAVRVDCVAEVGPEGEALGVDDEVALDGGEATGAVEVEEVPADDTGDHSGEEAGEGEGVALEAEDGEGDAATGLSESVSTT